MPYVIIDPWSGKVYGEAAQRWRAEKRLNRIAKRWGDDCPLRVKEKVDK